MSPAEKRGAEAWLPARRPTVRCWPHASGVAARALLLLTLLTTVACTATKVRVSEGTPLRRFVELSKPFGGRIYRIVPGDQLATRCYFNPQLDEEVQVRPDGNVSLSLIGEVKAAGKTAAELSAEITKGYARYFVKSTAIVIVRQFNGHRIFTAGELRNPGQFNLLTSARTVLESISASGGITDDATLQKIILIRKLPNQSQPMVAELDIQDALSGKDPTQNVALMPDDFVYVPKSGMADFNLAMRQYILNNLNFSSSAYLGTTYAPAPLLRGR